MVDPGESHTHQDRLHCVRKTIGLLSALIQSASSLHAGHGPRGEEWTILWLIIHCVPWIERLPCGKDSMAEAHSSNWYLIRFWCFILNTGSWRSQRSAWGEAGSVFHMLKGRGGRHNNEYLYAYHNLTHSPASTSSRHFWLIYPTASFIYT